MDRGQALNQLFVRRAAGPVVFDADGQVRDALRRELHPHMAARVMHLIQQSSCQKLDFKRIEKRPARRPIDLAQSLGHTWGVNASGLHAGIILHPAQLHLTPRAKPLPFMGRPRHQQRSPRSSLFRMNCLLP
jgi:hypothetical protein